MVNAVSNSVVPKITVIVGGSFGAGHYACAARRMIRVSVCVADGALCGDERRFGCKRPGGDQAQAIGSAAAKSWAKRRRKNLRSDEAHL